MHRIYFTLSIFVLASLLAGCAGSAVAQSNKVVLTDNPEKIKATIIPDIVAKNALAARKEDVSFNEEDRAQQESEKKTKA